MSDPLALFEGTLTLRPSDMEEALAVVQRTPGASASTAPGGITLQVRSAGLDAAVLNLLDALAHLGAQGAVHEADGVVSVVLSMGAARVMERQKVYSHSDGTAEATRAVLRAVRERRYADVPDALRTLAALSPSRAEATLDAIEAVALRDGDMALLTPLATVRLSDVRPDAAEVG